MKRRTNERTSRRIKETTAGRSVRCGSVVQYICDKLDEGLNSRKCREIRKHLKNCPNCTAYLDSVKKTVSLYQRVRSPNAGGKRTLDLKGLFEHVG